MSARKMLVATAAIGLSMSLAVPASSDEGLGVGTFAGEVIAMTGSVTSVRTVEIVGKCAYVGATTLTGLVQFAFSGETVSYSTVPNSPTPVGTRATCTLISPHQPSVPNSPPTLTMSTDNRLSGAVAATAPAVTQPWPMRPVAICVSGEALYSPAPVTRVLDQVCSDAALSPVGGTTACSDGADNDGDGKVDYPADPGCSSGLDLSEQDDPCGAIQPGLVGCLVPGDEIASYTIEGVDPDTGAGHDVAGYVDAYRFRVGAGQFTLPCVVLVADSATANPCAAAGGIFVSRDNVLVETTVNDPGVLPGSGVATVRVCEATLTFTVFGFGIDEAPAVSLC